MIDLEIGEEFREIDGFPGYFVTSFGRIISGPKRNHKEYISLSLGFNKGTGYLTFAPYLNGKNHSLDVHVQVAKAFIPNPEGKYSVNHKKGDKTLNRVDNLEWATGSEQQKHAIENGLRKRKLTLDQVDDIVKDTRSQRAIARDYGVSQPCIGKIKLRRG